MPAGRGIKNYSTPSQAGLSLLAQANGCVVWLCPYIRHSSNSVLSGIAYDQEATSYCHNDTQPPPHFLALAKWHVTIGVVGRS